MPPLLIKLTPLLLILALAACGDDSDSDSSTGTDTGSGDEQQPVTSDAGLAIGAGSGGDFQDGEIQASSTNVISGGSTELTFNIVDSNNGNVLFTEESVSITFASGCLDATPDRSSLNGPLSFSESSGTVTVSYTADDCSGTDTVSVSAALDGETIGQAVINLSIVEPVQAQTLSVATPQPQSLSPLNLQSDARPSVSDVVFTVRDRDGNGAEGLPVTFSLNQRLDGELAEGLPRLASSSVTTNEAGEAVAQVQAGRNNAVVTVTATVTLEDGSVGSTTSLSISVNEQLPVQTNLSISAETFTPDAYNEDGIEVPITIRASDRNNVLVSGQIVNFVTSAGAIQGECILENGACSVDWVSQQNRPADGRVTIMARTVGEDDFFDSSGSGEFQSTDVPLGQRGEPFLNIDWTGEFNPAEDVFFDQNNNREWDGPDGVYVGSACPEGADFCRRDTKSIWTSLIGFWMASNVLEVTLESLGDDLFCARVSGVTGGGNTAPPEGTSIDFSVADGASFVGPADLTSFEVDGSPLLEPFVEQCVEVVNNGTLSVSAGGDNSLTVSDRIDVGTGP